MGCHFISFYLFVSANLGCGEKKRAGGECGDRLYYKGKITENF